MLAHLALAAAHAEDPDNTPLPTGEAADDPMGMLVKPSVPRCKNRKEALPVPGAASGRLHFGVLEVFRFIYFTQHCPSAVSCVKNRGEVRSYPRPPWRAAW